MLLLEAFGACQGIAFAACRGLYDEAEALTQYSLDIAKSVYRHDENQTMLRRHRWALRFLLASLSANGSIEACQCFHGAVQDHKKQ